MTHWTLGFISTKSPGAWPKRFSVFPKQKTPLFVFGAVLNCRPEEFFVSSFFVENKMHNF